MALFKICKGAETNLPQTLTNGYCYFCTDTTNFYIDYTDTYGALTRSKISAKYADKLRYTEDGNFVEIEPTDVLTKNNYETAIGVAATDKNGLMSSADKIKLNNLPEDIHTSLANEFISAKGGAYSLDTTLQLSLNNTPTALGSLYDNPIFRISADGLKYSESDTQSYDFQSFFTPAALVLNRNYSNDDNHPVASCFLPNIWQLLDDVTGGDHKKFYVRANYLQWRRYNGGWKNHYISAELDKLKIYNDQKLISFENSKLENIASPTADNDAATKKYVDDKTPIEATTTNSGLMSAADKTKLDGIADGAEVNVQPDWNQNDETAADFVKNRPFYTGDPVETVLVEERTESFVEDSGLYVAEFPSTFEATVGETYKISWDSTVYECTCVDMGDVYVIGNLSIAGAGSDTGEPFLMVVRGGGTIAMETADTSASHTFSISGMAEPVVKIDKKYLPDNLLNITGAAVDQIAKISAVDEGGNPTEWETMDISNFAPAPFKPDGKSYLTFSSSTSFTLKIYNRTKHWDGTIEYFASDKTWTVWDGTTTLSAVSDDGEYVLYLRGSGNTVITGNSINYRWVLTGTDIKCIGNIENLLGYDTVESGAHPIMADYCYFNMFHGCTNLTQAPALPATTLSTHCYDGMFYGCTSLKLSTTQSDEYTQEYRIPSFGDGVTATNAFVDMFTNTGGTFTGTPKINTTYYLSSDNMIVRETEIATLNGYVRSMIDTVNAAVNNTETWTFTLSDGTTVTKQVVVK